MKSSSPQQESEAAFKKRIGRELARRRYFVMGQEELDRVWGASQSRSAREMLLRKFADDLHAKVHGWHDRGALLKLGAAEEQTRSQAPAELASRARTVAGVSV